MEPLFLITNYLGKNFLFHSNLSIKQKIAKKFAKFYQEILTMLVKFLFSQQKFLPLKVLLLSLSKKTLNIIGDHFENNGKMRSWEDLGAKLGLDDNKKFYW